MVDLGARYLERRRAWDLASLVPPSEFGDERSVPEVDRGDVTRGSPAAAVRIVVELTARQGVTQAADLTWDVAQRVVAVAPSSRSREAAGAARGLFAWIVAPDLVEAASRQAGIPELHAHPPREPTGVSARAERSGAVDSGGMFGVSLGQFLYWCGFHGWTDVRKLSRTTLDEYSHFLRTQYRPARAEILATIARVFVRWAPSTAPEFDATHVALRDLWVKRGFDAAPLRRPGSSHAEAFLARRSALRLHVLPWLAARELTPEELRREQLERLVVDMDRLPLSDALRRKLVISVAVDLYQTMVPLGFQEPVAQPVWVVRPADGGTLSPHGSPADLIRRLCAAVGGIGWSGKGVGPLLDVLATGPTEAERHDGLDRPLRTLAGFGTLPGFPEGVPLSPAPLVVWANAVDVGRYRASVDAYYLSDAACIAWQAMRLLSPPPPDDAGAVLRAAATMVAEAWPSARQDTAAKIIRLVASRPGSLTTDEVAARLPPDRSQSGRTAMTMGNVIYHLDNLRDDGVVHPYGSRPTRWGLAPGLATCISRWLSSSSPLTEGITITADEIHAHREHMHHVAIGAIARCLALPGAVEALTLLSDGDRGREPQWVDIAVVRGRDGMTGATLDAMRAAGLITVADGQLRIASPEVVDAVAALQSLAFERMRDPIRVVIGQRSAEGSPDPAGHGGVE